MLDAASLTARHESLGLPAGWLPLDYSHCRVWCPILREYLPDDPRDLDGLRAYRSRLYLACEGNLENQRLAWHLSKRSFSWWCNAFTWTPKGKDIDDEGKSVSVELKPAPWRHWPVNDATDAKYEYCRNEGLSLQMRKARDMRASLYLILRCVHNILFRPRWYGLLLSKKEADVDGSGPEGLIPRCRFVLKHLPAWMTHSKSGEYNIKSKHCLLENTSNGAFIGGTSSTEEPGTGMRPTEMIFDEAAKNPKFGEAWEQSAASTDFRIAVSTYKGPERFSRLDEEGVEVLSMAYFNHPEKGQGRRIVMNDNPFYPVKVGKPFVWTPWFHRHVWHEKKKAAKQTTVGVAQNIMMDKAAGSSGFFDGDVLETLLQRARQQVPTYQGVMMFDDPSPERDAAIMLHRSKPEFLSNGESFKWWGPWQGGRPIQDRTYCIFADISQGRGESNSVAAIGCREENRICGMYATSDADPYEFCCHLIMLSRWIGGRGAGDDGCLVGWEVNGPGEGLDRQFRKLKKRRLWSYDGDELGWRSTNTTKMKFGYDLSLAFQSEALRVDDPAIFEEARDWKYLTATTIGCEKTSDDANAKATHGDRVIGAMGCWQMLKTIALPVTLPQKKEIQVRRAQLSKLGLRN